VNGWKGRTARNAEPVDPVISREAKKHDAVHAQGCQGRLHAPFQPIVLAEVGLNPAQPQLGGIDPSAYLARR